ncbi:MAG TPA: hypothetical protein ENK98_01290, partial [Epsilonproteobacteria bacterium]|nr:hypothetical protein [Campylobacterota bacterium]
MYKTETTATPFLLFIIILSVYRAFMLYTINPDLYIDEAYYWVWSQNFDWGYYSKPPMIAWVISLATGLAGESSLVMKSI